MKIGFFLRLPEDIVTKLDEKAESVGVPRAAIIKTILHERLNNGK